MWQGALASMLRMLRWRAQPANSPAASEAERKQPATPPGVALLGAQATTGEVVRYWHLLSCQAAGWCLSAGRQSCMPIMETWRGGHICADKLITPYHQRAARPQQAQLGQHHALPNQDAQSWPSLTRTCMHAMPNLLSCCAARSRPPPLLPTAC